MTSILITGASAGIGAEIARRAAADGHDIGLNYRSDTAGAQSVADEIRALGRRVVLLRGDISDAQQVAQVFADHIAALGVPDAVINNAGIVPPRGRPLADSTPDEIALVINVNVTGAFYVARQAVRTMSVARGGAGGVLVNISSVAARTGSAGEYVDYAASKAAIDTLTLGLAHEHARDGVRVVGIRPGLIETGIHAKGGEPGRPERIAPAIPMGRVGQVGEIADAALFLISDKASYITGTMLDISGGR